MKFNLASTAEQVAARLRDVTPEGFDVTADSATVRCNTRSGDWVEVDLGEFEPTARGSPERLAWVIEDIMSTVQDLITEEITRPWPFVGSESGLDPLPAPRVVVDSSGLALFFGDPTVSALSIGRIEFDKIRSSP